MYMGHDQYGNHYSLQQHPRKELLEQLGRKHADKMYVDRHNGITGGIDIYHTGYIIAGLWITVFGLEGETFATKQG